MPSQHDTLARPSGLTGTRNADFKPRILHTVLIANRGEIALRLLRCARALSLKVVCVYTAEDEGAPHRAAADVAVLLHGREADGKGYLDMDAIVAAAQKHGAQAVLPGYGFLSERAAFADKVEQAGLVFVGPTAESIAQLGLKHRARELAREAGVPCVPGSDLVPSLEAAKQKARRVGYPIMLKASAGGGGLGLQVCASDEALEQAYASNVARAKTLFGDADCFVEKYVERGHHVEVQIFGNGQGDVIHLGERECSIQRRHQKIIEEAPSPLVERHPGLRAKMTTCAKSFGELTKYRSAGTLEFLVDDDTSEFYFLECNTRIQVEHCVTEEVWDVDIVALMLQQADAQLLYQRQHNTSDCTQGGIAQAQLAALEQPDPPTPKRWSIEARLYCENPLRNFDPSPGLLQEVHWRTNNEQDAQHVRIESWVQTGTRVTASYDPMLAKLIATGATREEATARLLGLLRSSSVYGPTNMDFLAAVLASEQFATGTTLTSFLQKSGFQYAPHAMEVLEHGMSTSIQDSGRRSVGHGLPPCGPADLLSFRLANALVGNKEDTEALEITFSGPTLKFHADAVVSLSGTPFEFTLQQNDSTTPLDMDTTYRVRAGSTLQIGMRQADAGGRAYLAVRGGFPEVPVYLTSKSTCAMLGLGGHQGRDLRIGDVLSLADVTDKQTSTYAPEALFSLPKQARLPIIRSPSADTPVTLYCMRGPFDDDEYITAAGRETLYNAPMRVSQNAARSGIRFDGHARLQWARTDGGQGGSHPSNMLEFGYPLNGVNWNGDTPVLLGVEGPDLGGLLISTTLISAEWRVGQLVPGMHVLFTPVSYEQACALRERQDAWIASVTAAAKAGKADGIAALDNDVPDPKSHDQAPSPILQRVDDVARPTVTLRAAGDQNLVVELGRMNADLVVRSRVELLLRAITERNPAGVLYTDVNIRTLTVRFDAAVIALPELVKLIVDTEARLPHDTTSVRLPYRVWRMPLCFGHPAVAASVDRYKKTVRNSAVYLDEEEGTDNRGYLARTNGLRDIDSVQQAILGSSFITVGNGFYLGTPILLPRDRRNRLRCQKYNPTRLQTAEGAFGWGGCMGAVYGVEAPGGYQLAARTLPFWSTFGNVPGFTPERPWLLQSFDTVDFYRVEPDEYDGMLAAFKAGSWQWDVREAEFNVAEQAKFDADIDAEAQDYEKKQAIAIAECERREEELYTAWRKEQDEAAEKKRAKASQSGGGGGDDEDSWREDPQAIKLTAPLAASVWKTAEVGKRFAQGEAVVVLEAMKTEVPVKAPSDIVVTHIVVQAGSAVQPGDVLIAGKAA